MSRFTLQPLEPRLLLATASVPWGPIPRLIRQDVAQISHAAVDGTGQTIAIIDTGIDYRHPSLGGGLGPNFKVVAGHDFVDNDEDPIDTSGHGTGVAGVLAAKPFTYQSRQYSGIAPNAKLIALRIADRSDDPAPNDRIKAALQWVIDHRSDYGITVVNISFGFGHFATSVTTGPFADEIAQLATDGIVIVSSSGNGGLLNGPGTDYPAADSRVISVGAVDSFDVITDFTERGPTLDMLAPGADVISTGLAGSFHSVNGTSYASPMVAGAVALMRQVDPAISFKDTLSALRSSGVDNTDGDEEFGNVTHLGFPRLDLENAIELTEARQIPLGGPNNVGLYGNNNGLAYDAQGILHFAWYDSAERTIKYATRNAEGSWSADQVIDTDGDNVGEFLSLKLDRNGKPSLAYFDSSKADLRYATEFGSSWQIRTIDSRQSTGLYPSLGFDQNNHPVISYYRKTSGDLRLARFDGALWSVRDLDTTDDSGRSTSLAMKKDGFFAVAYANSTAGRLKYAFQYNNSGWRTTTIDKTHGVAFISLQFNRDSQPCVSYYDAAPADLKYAVLKQGKWITATVVSKGAVGLYSQLITPPAGGNVSILYYNRNLDAVMRAIGHLGNWNITPLETIGGRFIQAVLTADNLGITYTWFIKGDAVLRLADV